MVAGELRKDIALVAANIYVRYMTDDYFARDVHKSENIFHHLVMESGLNKGIEPGTKEYEKLVLILEVLGTNGAFLP